LLKEIWLEEEMIEFWVYFEIVVALDQGLEYLLVVKQHYCGV
jgi:hypothetical protein